MGDGFTLKLELLDEQNINEFNEVEAVPISIMNHELCKSYIK